ncbi:hypothetical protein BDA99DRAFT_566147 [Phascolomyces articulosus]|uniref:Uncharacterized protein n=1 Tax=Phascolomyces articulosus TaxID=60185 RepID=A0AAD5JL96_9FUNG|nr:hypothetical protein BDA99DRAFT_566147 [Phascolomyces articulosus]
MNGCNASVLNSIALHTRNLSILGFNPNVHVPQLSSKNVSTNKDENKKVGLLALYTSNDLSIVNVDIQQPSIAGDHLIFWSEPNLQKMILYATQESTTLEYLAVGNVDDLEELANTLTHSLSPTLKKLKIWNDNYCYTGY